jgi:uncharacterized protein YaaN involved in tellurite resistance
MEDLVHRSDPAQPAGSGASWAIDPAQAKEIEKTVAEYVDTAVSLDSRDRKYLRTVAAIDRLGQREFTATAAMSGRILERRLEVARGLLADKAPLARKLAELRKIVDELNPARLEMGRKRSRGASASVSDHDELAELSGYFERFARSQERVEAILATIAVGRLALERDSALLGQELVSFAAVMETLSQNAYLTGRLDEALAARIDVVANADPERADCLRADLLHPVRRRRQEILTQLAVAMQGYMSLQIVEQTNQEMARAMGAASATTAAALRTAVMVAHAVAGQRLAMEQIGAADRAAEQMAGDASALVDRQSAALQRGIAGAGTRMTMLQHAWDEVFASLDRLDAQKEQGLRTISAADREGALPQVGSDDSSRGAQSGR